MGCLFFMVSFFGFSSLSALEVFINERKIFELERKNLMYSTHLYVLVEILFDFLPLRVLPPLLMGTLVYHPVGLRMEPTGTFRRFLLLLVRRRRGDGVRDRFFFFLDIFLLTQ